MQWDFKRSNVRIDVKSDVSCYVKIGEHTFYLEVSSATENKPYVTHWHGEMTNLECDICKILIENNNDRSACPKCAFYSKQAN